MNLSTIANLASKFQTGMGMLSSMSANGSSAASNIKVISEELKQMNDGSINVFTSTTKQILWFTTIGAWLCIIAAIICQVVFNKPIIDILEPVLWFSFGIIVTGFTVRYYAKKNNLGDMVISPTTTSPTTEPVTTATTQQTGPS